MDEGVMPGYAGVMNPNQRWDVINFIRARAAGARASEMGPEITTAAASEVPDFAFEAGGVQYTLRQMLETGPVLILLFGPPVPIARLQQLAAAQPRFIDAGLRVLAVGLGAFAAEISERARAPLFIVDVSSEVTFSLALFRATEDGGETELLLDRGGNVRARWTSNMPGGLAPPGSLIDAAERVSRISLSAPSHSGHTH